MKEEAFWSKAQEAGKGSGKLRAGAKFLSQAHQRSCLGDRLGPGLEPGSGGSGQLVVELSLGWRSHHQAKARTMTTVP